MRAIKSALLCTVFLASLLIAGETQSQSVILLYGDTYSGTDCPGPGVISSDGSMVIIRSPGYRALYLIDMTDGFAVTKAGASVPSHYDFNSYSSVSSDGKSVISFGPRPIPDDYGYWDLYYNEFSSDGDLVYNKGLPYFMYSEYDFPFSLDGSGAYLFYVKEICTQFEPGFGGFPGGCFSYETHLFKYEVKPGTEEDLGVFPDPYHFSMTEDAGYFAYASAQDIWVRNQDGSTEELLTQGRQPVITPDGSKILFECPDNTLCSIELDGSSEEVLSTLAPDYISTNNNGTKVTFTSHDGNDCELYYLDMDTSEVTRITDNQSDESSPRMAHNGNFIFSSCDFAESKYRIYLYLDLGQTSPGINREVEMSKGVQIKYGQVSSEGRIRMDYDDLGPQLPAGYSHGTEKRYYHIETTASFSGGVEVCINYNEEEVGEEDQRAHLLHYKNGAWRDITTWFNPWDNKICGRSSSLSDFTIAIGETPWQPSAELTHEFPAEPGSCGVIPGPGSKLACLYLLLPMMLWIVLFRIYRAMKIAS